MPEYKEGHPCRGAMTESRDYSSNSTYAIKEEVKDMVDQSGLATTIASLEICINELKDYREIQEKIGQLKKQLVDSFQPRRKLV